MSQIPGSGSSGGEGQPGANPAMIRRRPASVQLRAGQTGQDVQSLMDPANQSLAEALKITYRIIQLAMLGLVIAYAGSGFQSVKLTETGVRVTLGKAEPDPLPPGFAFSLPTPLGEVIKIDTSAQNADLDRQFFQSIAEENRRKPVAELEGFAKMRLDPLIDGANITGDLNLAHTKWKVQYQRSAARIRDYAQNINPDSEELIVKSAVMRGVVHAMTQVTIDELLRSQPDPERKGPLPLVEIIAKEKAQQALDDLKSGILITNVVLETRTPPLSLRKDFAAVDASKQDASTAASKAQQEQDALLTATAGTAYKVMLKLISDYDAALAQKDDAKAADTLDKVNNLLDGKKVAVDGVISPKIEGRAATMINEAQQYRAGAVSRASADAQVYAAKLAIYKQNPRLLVTGEWSSALQTLMASGNKPTIWWVPAGRSIDLWLNSDPEISRQREMENLSKRTKQINEREGQKIQDLKFDNLKTPSKEMKE